MGSKFGYASGSTVTQATSITTLVTLNALAGKITCVANAYAANTSYLFAVMNNTISPGDVVVANTSNANVGVSISTSLSGFSVSLFATGAAVASQAVMVRFAVIRAATT